MTTVAARARRRRSSRPDPLELWGGVECTVARVGDGYRDQVVETGHHERLDDLDRIAALGIRTLRYPVLWETISPDEPGRGRLRAGTTSACRRLQASASVPIAGLCHHGSGPRLHRPARSRLSGRCSPRHARARGASAIPGSALYTPVNEPLTTARFSGLYGHWYPHETGYAAVPPRARQSVPGDGPRHAGDPPGHARRAARPDRRSRQDLLDPGPGRPGRAREPAALARPSISSAAWSTAIIPGGASCIGHGIDESGPRALPGSRRRARRHRRSTIISPASAISTSA